MIRSSAVLMGISLLMAGCSSMSGLGASDRLSCPLANGVTCKSMSKVYADTVLHDDEADEHPQPALSGDAEATAPSYGPADAAKRLIDQPALNLAGMPLRSRPKVARIWVAPWVDADGDLNEGGFVDLRVDDGRWNVDHVRDTLRSGFGDHLKPPPDNGSADKPGHNDKDADAQPAVASPAATLPGNLLSTLAVKPAPAGGEPAFVPTH